MVDDTVPRNLLDAESESAVTAIIDNLEDTVNVKWKRIGDTNNIWTVENSPDNSVAAFVELVVNGTDAILYDRYRDKYGTTYDPSLGFTSYESAATDLLTDDHDYRIQITADGARANQAGEMNLTIADNGHGQPTANVKDTFLDLFNPGEFKQSFPFLQGQYGAGSKAVLPHCGDKGYKLILTASSTNPETWTWSLIRYNRSDSWPTYEYLTIDGDLPTFTGQVNDQTHGTVIKLYHYELEIQQRITRGLRHWLARLIWKTPVPIELYDHRESDHYSTTIHGGIESIINTYQEFFETEFTIHHDFGDPFGEQEIRVFVCKSDATIEDTDGLTKAAKRKFMRGQIQNFAAINFVVNGQTHGGLGQTFFTNRCNLTNVGKDTFALIELDDVDSVDLAELFKPTRDRINYTKEHAEVLMTELENAFQHNDDANPLHDLEEQRRAEKLNDEADEKVEEIASDIVKDNQTIEEWLRTGEIVPLSSPGDDTIDDTDDDYNPPAVPTTFRVLARTNTGYEPWDGDDPYTITLPENQHRVVAFELNAPNNYFQGTDGEDLTFSHDWLIKNWTLNDGRLRVRLTTPADIRGTPTVTATVTRPGDRDPLTDQFTVDIVDSVDTETTTSTPSPKNGGYDLPIRNRVTEDEWEQHDMDEHTPVRIDPPSKNSEMVVSINMDSRQLNSFLREHNLKQWGQEAVEREWELGCLLHSMTQYVAFEETDTEDPVTATEHGMQGVAETMLQQRFDNDDLDHLTT